MIFGSALIARTVDTRSAGSPLLCCPRDARVGERITLIAYRPEGGKSPYAEVGPVFIHADSCGNDDASPRYPEGFRHRRQIFRAYDVAGHIIDAVIVEGRDAEAAIDSLLGRSEVSVIQSRNVLYGCYMFAIRRSAQPASTPAPR